MKEFGGVLVGAGFGVAFVVANAHAPLGRPAALALRVAAPLALLAFLVLAALASRAVPGGGGSAAGSRTPAGRWFWIVVLAEVVVLFGGLQVLRAAHAPSQENVGWVALVVGLHFAALAVVWQAASLAVTGALVFLLGVAGVAMSESGAVRWVPFVSGVLSGIVLLGGSLLVAAGVFHEREVRSAAPSNVGAPPCPAGPGRSEFTRQNG